MSTRPVRRVSKQKLHRMPLGAPSRFWALSEWALAPLRAFLGFTFIFAGLQKIANPDFFSMTAPNGLHQQMIGLVRTSPIGTVVSHLAEHSTFVAWGIAIGELAIGIGITLGLFTRLAAIAGAALSFGLFLTVSWTTTPFYVGSDIVFFFAWIPFIVAGGGDRLSLDGRIRRRAARESGSTDPELVAIPFAQVTALCGNFQSGKCRAKSGAPCSPDGCPVLEGDRPSLPARGAVDEIDRRSLVKGGVAAAVAAGFGALIAGGTALVGRLSHSKSAASTTTAGPTTTTPAGANGTRVASVSQVPVGQSVSITIPGNGDPGLIVHTATDTFVCYDAICPHAGCVVGYSPSVNEIICPCHTSIFNVTNGDVISGPAPTGLTPNQVTQSADGGLYIA